MARTCDCPRCRRQPSAHPRYGYDRNAVPATRCLACGKRIGKKPYRHFTLLARFGQMLFVHDSCAGLLK